MTDRRLQRLLEAVVVGLLAASLVLPWSHEVEVETLRLLVGISGKTEVRASHLGDSMLHAAPYVAVSDNFAEEVKAHAQDSTDNYLLALAGVIRGKGDFHLRHDVPEPPSGVWTVPEVETWLAVWSVGVYASAWGVPNRRTPTWVRDALVRAQGREPSNGLLWYEEALADVEEGRVPEAIVALEEAGKRPAWDDHRPVVLTYVLGLLTSHLGLSKSEIYGGTVSESLTGLDLYPAPMSDGLWLLGDLLWDARSLPADSTRRAVTAFLALEGVHWVDPKDRIRFGIALGPNSSFQRHITHARCRDSWWEPEPEDPAWDGRLRSAFWASLPDPVLEKLVASVHASVDNPPPRSSSGTQPDWFDYARLLGMLHVLCAGIFLSLLVLGIPFRWFTATGRAAALREPKFWGSALAAVMMSVVLMFRTGTAGLGADPGPTLGVAVALSAAAVVMQIGCRRSRLRPLSFAVLWGIAALGTAVATGFYRAALMM